MATTRPHLGPLLAVGALSAATAFALTRVFAHTSWLAPVLVAALAPVVITWFAIAYRWTARGCALVSFYGAVWWSALVVNPDRTVLGVVPTPPGLLVWLRGIFDAPHVLRTAVVPVPPVGHSLELALFAMWIATAGAAWSAAKHDGVLDRAAPPLRTVHRDRLARQGRVRRDDDAVVRGRRRVPARAARRRGVAVAHRVPDRRRASFAPPVGWRVAAVFAIGFGGVVGPRLPDAASAPLLNYRHFGRSGGASQIVDISPLVGIKDKLNQPTPTVLFDVTATAQARWRLMALDEFDGNYWTLPNDTTATSTLSPDGPYAPGVLHQTITQQYTIGPMSGKFLPAAYRAVQTPHLSNLEVIADSATLVVPDESHDGLHYGLTSSLIGASPERLRAAPSIEPSDPLVVQNLQLPASLSPAVRAEAARVVSGATTEYDKALRLQQYFRDPKRFTYDQSVDLSESSDAMVDFLFHVRRGFCEQFAGTFAAMARAVGLPTACRGRIPARHRHAEHARLRHLRGDDTRRARLAGGLLPACRLDRVRADARSLRLRLTRQPERHGHRRAAVSGRRQRPQGASTTTTPPTTTPANQGPTRTRGRRGSNRLEITPPPGQPGSHGGQSGHGALWLLVPGALLAVLLLAAGTIVARQAASRWRRSHSSTPRARIDGAWADVTEELARYDIRRRPAATLVEFALREAPAAGAGGAGPPLLELAQLQTARDVCGRENPRSRTRTGHGNVPAPCAARSERRRPAANGSAVDWGSGLLGEEALDERRSLAVNARTSASTSSTMRSTGTNNASWPCRSASST